eukprot:gnl/TRDRNA2_/TRDRNA2_120175_c0_seq1.p1 gnl/TRDRNA2_/TRDRNA2_120175_c0~~gnl/TRDRNA2_/TRDRNA2_120175_c0_seq1.p1  ORF type:complete len:468 (-),score=81.45 gnl/TRDRNA2_/TRDRNA2_120175_c0_seq1:76-1281(-)
MACGGDAAMLGELLLLTPTNPSDIEVLLFFCDLVVLRGNRILFLYVAVLLINEAVCENVQTNALSSVGSTVASALSSLGSFGCPGVKQLVDEATDLHLTTPLNSEYSAFFSPICMVSPNEILRHIYERPRGTWRLVVIDVRKSAIHLTLPVCIRFGNTEDRQALAESIPYEECIHLCLMADEPPASGEEAFELARHLTGAPKWFKHVSVVAGGWPAVEFEAAAMGVELTQVETQKDGQLLLVRKDLQKNLKKAQKAVVKNAHRALTDMSHLLKRTEHTFGRWGAGIGIGRTQTQSTDDREVEVQNPNERDMEFADGPLGFDLCGTQVILVEEGGQAEKQGLQVGDKLVAVAGKRIPPPPAGDPVSVGEDRVKKLIKKWIKQQVRPVQLTFAAGEAPLTFSL